MRFVVDIDGVIFESPYSRMVIIRYGMPTKR